MDSRDGLIRLAVFGSPVRHSLSPRIHAAFAVQASLEIRYSAVDTPAGALADALQTFATAGGIGCNITLPLKREAMLLASRCSDRVRRAEAANTLALQEAGGWRAENTDGTGLVRDMRTAGLRLAGARVALLGAGGAASGVLAALLDAGPEEVLILNRTADRAARLARRHADLGPVAGAGQLPEDVHFDLLINATSAGHDGRLPPMAQTLLGTCTACYDLNYGPAAEPLRDACARAGIPYRDGLGMLVEQGAESFSIWTGFRPDAAPVMAELRRARV